LPAFLPRWGIASKYFLRSGDRHFFNPSNFAIVTALLLMHGVATVSPGSQWGADFRIAALIPRLRPPVRRPRLAA
jgi:Na+-transporting NADH:ubiquinone oxidoreductase subunit NqrB